MSEDQPAADDVDDRVINRIFGCGMTIAAILGRPDISDEVSSRLLDVVDELDAAVATVRHAALARALGRRSDEPVAVPVHAPVHAARSLSMRNPAADIRVVQADGRRRLCRFAADEAFAYALRGQDFYRASDDVLWAHEREGLLLSARTGTPFARRDGSVFFDMESNAPLYYEDGHASSAIVY